MLFHMGKIMAVPWDFPVVSWHDDRVGGLDANWNCEAPTSELCLFKQMIQNVIAFFFCPPHPFGKGIKGCGERPLENTAGGYLEHLSQCLLCTVTPCPAKRLSDSLFLQAIRQLGCMRSPPSVSVWPWQCWSLWCSFPICLPSKGWSGFCSWAVLTAALTLQSALLSLPGQAAVWPCVVLKRCMRELKEERRGSS